MHSQEGKFSLGAIEIMPDAQQALLDAGQPAAAYLYQHQYETPDERIGEGGIVSVFHLPTGATIYIITDEAHVHTVVMTPDDAGRTEVAP